MPDLLQYADYRDFIRDRFEIARSQNPRLSFQSCAKRLKTAKSYLKLVIDKKRHISLEKISALAQFLKLSVEETQGLTFLYLRDTVKDERLRRRFADIVDGIQSRARYGHPAMQPLSGKDLETTFVSWLHMALLSMAKLRDFTPDVDWMQAKLGEANASREDVARSWNDLLSMGAVCLTEDGRAEVPGFVFRTADPYAPDRFQIYRIGLEKTLEVVSSTHAGQPRGHFMMCLSLSKADAEKARERFFQLRDELIALSQQSTERETVVFFSNNMFNLLVDR